MAAVTHDFKIANPDGAAFDRDGDQATVKNWEKRLITVAVNEAARGGTRDVVNLANGKTLNNVGTGVATLISGTNDGPLGEWDVTGLDTSSGNRVQVTDAFVNVGAGVNDSFVHRWSIKATVAGDIGKTVRLGMEVFGGTAINNIFDIVLTENYTSYTTAPITAANNSNYRVYVVGGNSGTPATQCTVSAIQVENVTGQSNKTVSAVVSDPVSLDTLNANTVDSDGVVTERVGAKIDQRKLFDGVNDYVSIPEIDLTNYEVYITSKANIDTSTGAQTLLGHSGGSAAGSGYVRINTSGNVETRGGGTEEVDGSGSTSYPNDLKDHYIKITGIGATHPNIDRIAIRTSNNWSGAISDVLFIDTVGSAHRHYKLDELTGTVAVNSIAPGTNDGTYVNMSDPLPLLDSVLIGTQLEPVRTNRAIHARDMSDAAWVKTNITATKTVNGLDGAGSSASRVTATAGNGTIFQTITSASTLRTYSADIKRVTGTGVVEMTVDGGTTYTAITGLINTSTYTRVQIPQTVANPQIGFRIVTSGDAINVDYNQEESGGYATSRIPTEASAITRDATDGPDGTIAAHAGDIINGTLIFSPMFASDDDKGSDVVVWELQGASVSDYFHVRLDQNANTVMLTKTRSGQSPVSAAVSHTYVHGDILTVVYNYTLADGLTISVNGGTAGVNTTAEAKAVWANPLTTYAYGSKVSHAHGGGMFVCENAFTTVVIGTGGSGSRQGHRRFYDMLNRGNR